jgi:predicted O-methyltransferase YrrM
MVDSWLPEEQQPESYRGYGDYHSKFTALQQKSNRNAATVGTSGFGLRRVIIARPSVEAAENFDDNSMDFVFLDADHSYESVKADITAWWPKIKPGGWLCGHDYGGWLVVKRGGKETKQYFGVKQAVDEFAEGLGLRVEPDEDYTFFLRRPLGGGD